MIKTDHWNQRKRQVLNYFLRQYHSFNVANLYLSFDLRIIHLRNIQMSSKLEEKNQIENQIKENIREKILKQNSFNLASIQDNQDDQVDRFKSYLRTYPYVLKYLKSNETFNEESLFCALLMTYGWMPRILNIHIEQQSLTEIIGILNTLKSDSKRIICESDLNKLKGLIDNSLAGTTKLLHFCFPEVYPIWDSTIAEIIKPKGINEIRAYLAYLKVLKTPKELFEVDDSKCSNPIYSNPRVLQKIVTDEIKKLLEIKNYPRISFVRAIDLLIFASKYQKKD